jgi:hypothetical protein
MHPAGGGRADICRVTLRNHIRAKRMTFEECFGLHNKSDDGWNNSSIQLRGLTPGGNTSSVAHKLELKFQVMNNSDENSGRKFSAPLMAGGATGWSGARSRAWCRTQSGAGALAQKATRHVDHLSVKLVA